MFVKCFVSAIVTAGERFYDEVSITTAHKIVELDKKEKIE
jgi:hypothetical protein